MMPVGMPPIMGARAGFIKVDIYLVPAIMDPPSKNGLIYFINDILNGEKNLMTSSELFELGRQYGSARNNTLEVSYLCLSRVMFVKSYVC
jgi:hypothetical protein